MARPKKRSNGRGASKGYGWDRFLGAVGIIFDVLGVAFGSWAMHYGLTDPRVAKMNQPVIYGGFGLLVILLALVGFAINLGVYQSRRWAFVLSALMSGYGMSSGAPGFSGVMLLFTVLRLGQVFGPSLR